MGNYINYEVLHRHILKTAQNTMKEAVFEVVKTGVIKEILPDEYYIQLTDSSEATTIRATIIGNETEYQVDDLVYLLTSPAVGGDQMTVKYFIFGLVSVTDQNFAALSDFEKFQLDESSITAVGGDGYTYSNSELEKELARFVIGDSVGGTDLITSIKLNRGVMLEAIFNTNNINKIIEYGLKIEFYTKENGLIETAIFNDEWFIGQPFELTNSKQKFSFSLTEGQIKDLYWIKISAFQNGLEEGMEITATEIKIAGGILKDLNQNLSVVIQVDGSKNYFKKGADETEKVVLNAIALYKNQRLSSNAIKYYWFIKDESVSIGSEGYSSLAGEGWRCLNKVGDYHIIGYGGSNENKKVSAYISEGSKFELIAANTKDYDNKIKCVIGYQLINKSSKEETVYNFNYEAFSAELSANTDDLILYTPSDKIELTCKILNENFTSDLSKDISYSWWIKEEGKENFEELIGFDKNIIILRDNDNENKNNEYDLLTRTVEIRCVANIEDGKSIEESNILKIKSLVNKDNNFQEVTFYKYLISDSMSIDYEQIISEEVMPSTGLTLKVVDWIPIGGGNWSEKIDYLYENIYAKKGWSNDLNAAPWFFDKEGLEEGEYYLHVCSRNVTITADSEQLVSVNDWQKPFVARHVWYTPKQDEFPATLEDLKSIEEMGQLNTFNSLTNNGKSQGIYYTNEEYLQTADAEPVEGKNYFIKEDYYIPCVIKPGLEDIENEIYYLHLNQAENGLFYKLAIKNDFILNEDNSYSFNPNFDYAIKDKQDIEKYKDIKIINELELKNGEGYYTWWEESLDEDGNIKPAGYYPWIGTESDELGQIYYEKNFKPYYTSAGKIESFDAGVIYYEKVNDKDLYINASFINTGTLRVGDSDTEKFYANINNSDVRIAGFQVDEHTLSSLGFQGAEGNGELKDDGIFVWDPVEEVAAAEPMLMSLRPEGGEYAVNTMSLDDGVTTVANDGYTLSYVSYTGGYSVSSISITSSDIWVKIPSTYFFKNVVRISNAFISTNCSKISKITIPGTLKTIQDGSFSGCTNITNFYYYTDSPNPIFQPINGSLWENENISSIGNEKVWKLVAYAAGRTDKVFGLSSVSPVTDIYSNKDYCRQAIGSYAFSNSESSALKTIQIGENDTDNGTFYLESYWYDGLPDDLFLYIAPNATVIIGGSNSFPKNFTTAEVPISALPQLQSNSISELTINGGTKLTTSNYINKFQTLEKLTIGSTVEKLTGLELKDCLILSEIAVKSSNSYLASLDGNLYSKDLKVFKRYSPAKTDTVFELPSTVTSIEDYAFYNCSNLKVIKFNGTREEWNGMLGGSNAVPSSIAVYYSESFSEGLAYSDNGDGTCTVTGKGTCSDKYIRIPSSVILNDVELTVTQIKAEAFKGQTTIVGVELPDTLENIGANAFKNCTNLMYNIPDGDEYGKYLSSSSNEYFALISTSNNSSSVTSYQINEGAKIIAGGAISGFRYLKTLYIPANINSFSENAFIEYTSNTLTTVYYDGSTNWSNIKRFNSVSSPLSNRKASLYINNSTKVTSISSSVLGDVNTINNYAFYKIADVTDITIPTSVQEIGTYGLYTSNVFDTIHYESTWEEFQNINKAENWANLSTKKVWYYCSDYVVEQTENSTVCFQLDENNNTYTCVSATFSGEVEYTIPDEIDGCLVNKIAAAAFKDSSVTKVTLGNNIKEIGEQVFSNCANLTAITLPNNNEFTTIKVNTFENCSSLQNILLDENISIIETGAFVGCSSLTTIMIYNHEIIIGENIFSDDATTTIYYEGTQEDWDNVNAQIPSTIIVITLLDSFEFTEMYDENGLLSGYSVGKITEIDYTFEMENVIVPKTYNGYDVIGISNNGFENCISIKNVEFHEKIQFINQNAFSGCSELTEIIIPDSVTYIGYAAFKDCSSLTTITIPFVGDGGTTNTYFGYIFGTSSYNDVPSSLIEVIITGGTSIYANAFWNCKYIQNLTIPDSIISVGSNAFSNCSSLTNIITPTVAISKVLQSSKNSLKEITITFGDEIVKDTFRDCIALEKVSISASITNIADLFIGCNALKEFIVDENSEHYESYQGNLYTKGKKTLVRYASGKEDTYFETPNETTGIAEYTCYMATKLTEIVVGDNVETIGQYAFCDCYSLEKITLPFVGQTKDGEENNWFGYVFGASNYDGNSNFVPTTLKTVNIIGGTIVPNYTFFDCSELTNIILPDSITFIGTNAFCNCHSLVNIKIPDNVEQIESLAFQECWGLTSIVIPDNAIFTGTSIFLGCSSLIDITIPTIKIIKDGEVLYDRFYYLWGNSVAGIFSTLKTVTITQDTSISASAFYNCDNIETIKLQGEVTNIGYRAFYGCSSLKNIIIPDSLVNLGSQAFRESDKIIGNIDEETGLKYLGNEDNPYLILIHGNNITAKSIRINPNCKFISYNAFEYINSTTIEIPTSVCWLDDIIQGSNYYSSIKYEGTLRDWVQLRFYSSKSSPFYDLIDFKVYNPDTEEYETVTEINLGDGKEKLLKKENETITYSLIAAVEEDEPLTIKNNIFYGLSTLTSNKIILPADCIIEPNAFDGIVLPTEVYYEGTDITWNELADTALWDATVYYYSDSRDTQISDYNYWKYSQAKGIQISDGTNGMHINTPYFQVDDMGRIRSTSGKIGGWDIQPNQLSSSMVGMRSSEKVGDYAFWAGSSDPNSATFAVKNDGYLYAMGAYIRGNIQATSITAEALTAQQAHLQSLVVGGGGGDGYDGGWTFDVNQFYSETVGLIGSTGSVANSTGLDGSQIRIYAGSSTPNNAPFYVTNDGYIVATTGQFGSTVLNNSLGGDYTGPSKTSKITPVLSLKSEFEPTMGPDLDSDYTNTVTRINKGGVYVYPYSTNQGYDALILGYRSDGIGNLTGGSIRCNRGISFQCGDGDMDITTKDLNIFALGENGITIQSCDLLTMKPSTILRILGDSSITTTWEKIIEAGEAVGTFCDGSISTSGWSATKNTATRSVKYVLLNFNGTLNTPITVTSSLSIILGTLSDTKLYPKNEIVTYAKAYFKPTSGTTQHTGTCKITITTSGQVKLTDAYMTNSTSGYYSITGVEILNVGYEGEEIKNQ